MNGKQEEKYKSDWKEKDELLCKGRGEEQGRPDREKTY